MNKVRFHVLGLAHQPVTTRVTSCAYTMKVVNMCRMLKAAGHEVFLYHAGSIISKDISDVQVMVVSDDTMTLLYGPQFYDTYNQGWSSHDKAWVEFRRNSGLSIARRLSGGADIVLASYGNLHSECCPAGASALTVEMGIGYEGVFADCKVWESHAWKHYVYGRYPSLSRDRDTVIPGYFDPKDFVFKEEKGDYLLYMGRVIEEKGVVLAAEAAKLTGMNLVVVGKGEDSMIRRLTDLGATCQGMVSASKRSKLLSSAAALVAFTQYVEPFGNVAIEAMYSGTPVISSDWGGFTETVVHGRTGFRCADFPQLVSAFEKIKGRNLDKISPAECHEFARRFTLENIWPRYEAYFDYQLKLFKTEHGYD